MAADQPKSFPSRPSLRAFVGSVGLWNATVCFLQACRAVLVWRVFGQSPNSQTGPGKSDRQSRQDDFDTVFGTDTGTDSAGISEARKYNDSLGYAPTPPYVIETVLDRLGVRYSDYTFVDAGAGKGRVLLIAAKRPFIRVIGIEVDHDYVSACRANVDKYATSGLMATSVSVISADAGLVELPITNMIIYMFAPFGLETFDRLFNNIQKVVSGGNTVLLVWITRPPLFIRKYRTLLRNIWQHNIDANWSAHLYMALPQSSTGYEDIGNRSLNPRT